MLRQVLKLLRQVQTFLFWKIAQNILQSINKSNREGKIFILLLHLQDHMNSLLLKKKEFKEEEVLEDLGEKTWKSYVNFPEALMVKKQQMKNTKSLTVIHKIY